MKHKQGFTLLYAVVVTSILLASALSIISIALRELALSTSSRDSQYAFYVANTGLECAMYWDKAGAAESEDVGDPPIPGVAEFPIFVSPDGSDGISPAYNGPFEVYCLGGTGAAADIRGGTDGEYHYENTDSIDIYPAGEWLVSADEDVSTTKFRISFTGDAAGACADVLVTKEDIGANIQTTIESRGYNTCATSKRRVERGVQTIY